MMEDEAIEFDDVSLGGANPPTPPLGPSSTTTGQERNAEEQAIARLPNEAADDDGDDHDHDDDDADFSAERAEAEASSKRRRKKLGLAVVASVATLAVVVGLAAGLGVRNGGRTTDLAAASAWTMEECEEELARYRQQQQQHQADVHAAEDGGGGLAGHPHPTPQQRPSSSSPQGQPSTPETASVAKGDTRLPTWFPTTPLPTYSPTYGEGEIAVGGPNDDDVTAGAESEAESSAAASSYSNDFALVGGTSANNGREGEGEEAESTLIIDDPGDGEESESTSTFGGKAVSDPVGTEAKGSNDGGAEPLVRRDLRGGVGDSGPAHEAEEAGVVPPSKSRRLHCMEYFANRIDGVGGPSRSSKGGKSARASKASKRG